MKVLISFDIKQGRMVQLGATWQPKGHRPGNSAGDLFGMVKNVTLLYGCWWPPNRGSKGHGLNHLETDQNHQKKSELKGFFPTTLQKSRLTSQYNCGLQKKIIRRYLLWIQMFGLYEGTVHDSQGNFSISGTIFLYLCCKVTFFQELHMASNWIDYVDSIHLRGELQWRKKKNVTASALKEDFFLEWMFQELGGSPIHQNNSMAVSRRSWERMWARRTSLVLQIHLRLWASNFPSLPLGFTFDCRQTLWTKTKKSFEL